MQAGGSNEVIRILAASVSPESGPGGIGIVALNVAPTRVSRIYEQAVGTADVLHYRSVIRALELAQRLHARKVVVSSGEESIVKQVNREMPVPQGGRLPLLYIKIRALMHTFEAAEVVHAPRGVIEPARRLAQAASRIPVRTPPRTLFSPVHS